MKISRDFYQREDVVQIAKDLLGKVLVTDMDGTFTSGIIVETEAYNGRTDKACHAYGGRRTSRTEVIYKAGGLSYVYLCYGIHSLFNIVTNVEGKADAVLIRAVEPLEGIETMLKRRKMELLIPRLTAGPGAMSQAMGITTNQNKVELTGNKIWVEDQNVNYDEKEIIAGPRVGVAYAQEDALLPWRFSVKNNNWISKAKG